jgi:hypothetical protein
MDQLAGIIRRNILNYLVQIFDGPHLIWHETKR